MLLGGVSVKILRLKNDNSTVNLKVWCRNFNWSMFSVRYTNEYFCMPDRDDNHAGVTNCATATVRFAPTGSV